MSKPHDEYKRLEAVIGTPCPVCGADAQLWQYGTAENDQASKVVMCSNGEAFGPQDGSVSAGCLLYMLPNDHYRPTQREAIRHWDEYARALNIQRRQRNLKP